MEKVKVGLIGCGMIVRTHHLENLETNPDVEISAACDIKKEVVENIGKRCRCSTYQDYHKMMDKEKLDAVIISIPPFAHTDEVQVAAEREIHVFIEKPIALTLEKAKEMVEVTKRYKVKTQVGFCYRYSPIIQRLKSLIEMGEFGRPGFFAGRYSAGGFWALHLPWWKEKDKSGGQLTEQSIHLIDLCRFLMGEVDTVFCAMNTFFFSGMEGFTTEDVSSTTLRLKSGAIASVDAVVGALPKRWDIDFRIVGDKMTADIGLFAGQEDTFKVQGQARVQIGTFYYTKERLQKEQIETNKDYHRAELVDFIDMIKNNKEPKVPIEEGLRALELTLAANKSARTGIPVKLPLKNISQ